MGHAETFMYRYLSGLGASSLLLGATVTVGGCVELLLMFFATAIVVSVGVYPVMVFSFGCYGVRFIGESGRCGAAFVRSVQINR